MKNSQKSNFDLVSFVTASCERSLEENDRYREFRTEILSLYQPVLKTDRFAETGEILIRGVNSNQEIVILAVLSYYMDPILGFLIRIELENKIRGRRGSEDLLFLLEGREVALNYILTSSRFNERKVKGLFSIKNLTKFLYQIEFIPKKRKTSDPKRLIRHKGYRDKGTLPDTSVAAIRQEIQNEAAFREKQIENEIYDSNIEYYLKSNLAWLRELKSSMLSENFYFNKQKGVIYYEDDRIINSEDRKQSKSTGRNEKEERKS
jgi:hypothetical protein